MTKILVVEDTPRYSDAADAYFSGKLDASYATDYDTAMAALPAGYDGALVDCFFPKRTGSGDISLGRQLAERFYKPSADMENSMKLMEDLLDLKDAEMNRYARIIASSQGRELPNNPVFLAIRQVSETCGKELATAIAKRTLEHPYEHRQAPKDYYGAIMKAMERSENNQPLGVLVAEKVQEIGLPFVLVTSTHHHDDLTEPIYVHKHGWRIVDCDQPEKKATPEFWEGAFKRLLVGMETF